VLSLVLPPFSNKISSDDSSAHFEIPVPPGHVPVVIEASPETLAGVRPTSPRYNVIIVKRDDQGKSRAAILLKNVVVLEEKFDVETDQNGLHRPKHLVTLALKPADVSILERAKQEGVIGLALRPVYPLSDAEASKVIEHAPR
jgi:Flp pilus assembly protein CpaB